MPKTSRSHVDGITATIFLALIAILLVLLLGDHAVTLR
jgi:hypothetical protein